MGVPLKIVKQAAESASTVTEVDYSLHTLQQLLKARPWFDAKRSRRGRRLEEEIQKRCAPNKLEGSSAAGAVSRYRPYGLMLGIFFLALSSGPFVAIEFLDGLNLVADVNGDNAFLSGVWALFTLPFAVLVFMIGGIVDAERVVKWFNL
jgi:hypothetical protein